MKVFFQKNHRLLFYSSWIILGLIQSRFTELLDDEAYYWVYSKFLDWGYFDHPPMTALLIKIGYFIFQNELGVRLLFLFLNVLSLLIIEKLIDKRNPFLFYGIVLSLAVLQLSGFLAVPDTPLIFFLVSNLKLFSRYQTYLAGLVALFFFTPHLWWQYQHNWVSFRYHLFESNVNPYKLSFTLEYLGGQVLLAGPLAGVILLPAAFLYYSKNVFEKGLKFTLAGVYIFFFLSSFRGQVEANWTSPAIVPLIVLSHNFLRDRNTPIAIGGQKWLLRLLPLTMIFVLFARIIMIVDILPVKGIKKQYHGWKDWPQIMKQKSKGLPIVFVDSYQRASKYWFYTGQMTYSLNYYRERRNNYNFWPIEDSILGKQTYILDVYDPDSFQTRIPTAIGTLNYKYDSAFSSFAKVKFVSLQKKIEAGADRKLIEIKVRAELPKLYYTYITTHPFLETRIVVGVFNKYRWIKDLAVPYSLYEMIQQQRSLHFDLQLPNGKYYLIFSIYHIGTVVATHNSEKIELIVQ